MLPTTKTKILVASTFDVTDTSRTGLTLEDVKSILRDAKYELRCITQEDHYSSVGRQCAVAVVFDTGTPFVNYLGRGTRAVLPPRIYIYTRVKPRLPASTLISAKDFTPKGLLVEIERLLALKK